MSQPRTLPNRCSQESGSPPARRSSVVGKLKFGILAAFSKGERSAMSDFLFTSESVSEGHPDKVADQISDAVLDAILKQDKTSRVAAETLVKDNLVVLAGEITTHARVNYDEVARNTIKRIGYIDPAIGFDASACTVLVEASKPIAGSM